MGIKPLMRPATRKSQIIEEEEDAEAEDEEEIEEVEAFTPEATKTSFEEIHTTDEIKVEAPGDEIPLPVLAPPAGIRPSSHPPRSSSLKDHPGSFMETPTETSDMTVVVPQEEPTEQEVPQAAAHKASSETINSETTGETAEVVKVES